MRYVNVNVPLSINTTFFDYSIWQPSAGGCDLLYEFGDLRYQLLVWRAIYYYVRAYAKILVIRKFCNFSYLLFTISLYKLSYLRAAIEISMERAWPTMGCCPKCRQFMEY